MRTPAPAPAPASTAARRRSRPPPRSPTPSPAPTCSSRRSSSARTRRRSCSRRCAPPPPRSWSSPSNTSSLSIGELGRAYGRPERLLGLHFFNPVERMRLVEVVRGPHTDPELVERARGWVAALGKTAVVCVDAPNFVVNRVCRPLYYEAQLLATQGVEPAVVDAVARGALGHRMGPLELARLHRAAHPPGLVGDRPPRARRPPLPADPAHARARPRRRDRPRRRPRLVRPRRRAAESGPRRVVERRERRPAPFSLEGPGARELLHHPRVGELTDEDAPLMLYSAPTSCGEREVAAVRELVAGGREDGRRLQPPRLAGGAAAGRVVDPPAHAARAALRRAGRRRRGRHRARPWGRRPAGGARLRVGAGAGAARPRRRPACSTR